MLLRYDSNLSRIWKVLHTDNSGGNFLAVAAVNGAEDAVGSVDATNGHTHFLIEKYDDKGARIWSKVSGGSGSDELT